jgi:hypothetical protein
LKRASGDARICAPDTPWRRLSLPYCRDAVTTERPPAQCGLSPARNADPASPLEVRKRGRVVRGQGGACMSIRAQQALPVIAPPRRSRPTPRTPISGRQAPCYYPRSARTRQPCGCSVHLRRECNGRARRTPARVAHSTRLRGFWARSRSCPALAPCFERVLHALVVCEARGDQCLDRLPCGSSCGVRISGIEGRNMADR